jgi:hypothetical protein
LLRSAWLSRDGGHLDDQWQAGIHVMLIAAIKFPKDYSMSVALELVSKAPLAAISGQSRKGTGNGCDHTLETESMLHLVLLESQLKERFQ